MSVEFIEEGHKYMATDGSSVKYTSVTTLIHKYEEKFQSTMMSQKVTKKIGGKYEGLKPQEVLDIWSKESTRATDIGSMYHNFMEQSLLGKSRVKVRDTFVNVIPTTMINGRKEALPQLNLKPGVYPEFLIYDKALGISGQVDEMMISEKNILDIDDHKTNKEFKDRGYLNTFNGSRKKLLAPLSHLEDCDKNVYALQMSLYAYMILRRNRHLKLGRLQINHVEFEVASRDEYDFPTIKMDVVTGLPIVKKITPIQLPFLQKEVIALIKHFRKTRE
jgi:hypothetical protein